MMRNPHRQTSHIQNIHQLDGVKGSHEMSRVNVPNSGEPPCALDISWRVLGVFTVCVPGLRAAGARWGRQLHCRQSGHNRAPWSTDGPWHTLIHGATSKMSLEEFWMFFVCTNGFANWPSTVLLSAQVPKQFWTTTFCQGNTLWEGYFWGGAGLAARRWNQRPNGSKWGCMPVTVAGCRTGIFHDWRLTWYRGQNMQKPKWLGGIDSLKDPYNMCWVPCLVWETEVARKPIPGLLREELCIQRGKIYECKIRDPEPEEMKNKYWQNWSIGHFMCAISALFRFLWSWKCQLAGELPR